MDFVSKQCFMLQIYSKKISQSWTSFFPGKLEVIESHFELDSICCAQVYKN